MKLYALKLSILLVASLLVGCNPGHNYHNITPSVIMDSVDGGVANGATDVSLNPLIILKFSTGVDPVTINENTIKLSTSASGSNPVALSPIISNQNNTLFSFSASNALSANTNYYVIIENGVTALNGQSVPTTIFNFTTGTSPIPTVAMIHPASDATDVSASTNIQLQFSKAVQNVNSSTISLHENSAGGALVAITPITYANDIYTFSSASPLSETTVYYVVIGNGITDADGNSLAAASFSFTTGDFTNPTVNIIAPTNGAINIGAIPIIQVQFSEPVQGVNTTTVSLHAGAVNGPVVPITIPLPGLNNNYTFSPFGNLSPQITYYLTLSSGINDVNNNSLMAANFSFNTANVLLAYANQVGGTGFSSTFGQAVSVDASNNAYIAGYTSVALSGQAQQGAYDHLIAKYNPDGSLAWYRQLGNGGFNGQTYGMGVSADSSGNSYITGYTNVGIGGQPLQCNGIGCNDYYIARYDSTGTRVWLKEVGGAPNGNTQARAVAVDNSGHIYVTGSTNTGISGQPLSGFTDYFIAQYDSSGNLGWSRQVGLAMSSAAGYGVSIGPDGIYIIGYTSGGLSGQSQNGNQDCFVAKYDTSGNLIWSRQLGAIGGLTYGYGISVNNSKVFVAGYTNVALPGQFLSGINDYLIAQYDLSGNLVWLRQLGVAGGITQGYGISADSNGNSYIAGSTTAGLSQLLQCTGLSCTDYFIVKYDSFGNLLQTTESGAVGTSKAARGIALDGQGNSYIAGKTAISNTTYYFIDKYFN